MVSDESRIGFGILGAATALGSLHDLMLDGKEWGINVVIVAVLDVITLAMLRRWHRTGGTPVTVLGGGAILLFASCVALRASPILIGLDLAAIGVILAMLLLGGGGQRPARAAIADYLRSGLRLIGGATVGTAAILSREIEWDGVKGSRGLGRFTAILRGGILALPVLLLFGGLLISADPLYRRLLVEILDIGALLRHGVWSLFFAWGIAGVLGVMLLRGLRPSAAAGGSTMRAGATEIAVVLGAIDLLFISFVVIQLRYLFGGADFVREGGGLTFAEYARSGFFELVTITAVELPLLLAADWLARAQGGGGRLLLRGLSLLQVLLLFVIMASALFRMQTYQAEYGQTELRFYTTAFMWWMGALFLWFVLTVLRGHRASFAGGAALSGLLVILLLNVLNPDARIAATNIERGALGKAIDADYLGLLSADAVPTIVEGMKGLSSSDRTVVARRLAFRWGGTEEWLSWNWSRARARASVSRAGDAMTGPSETSTLAPFIPTLPGVRN